MINSFRNLSSRFPTKIGGAAAFVMTIVLMVAALFMVMYAARFSTLQTKTSANQFVNAQSYEAAEAGVEYGIAYLNQYADAIAATAVSGFVVSPTNPSLSNFSQPDGSSYSVIISNPVANNYERYLITSTGESADGTSSKIIRQLVQKRGLLNQLPLAASTIQGNVLMQGNSHVVSTDTDYSIIAGGNVNMSGSASSSARRGSSSSSGLGNDVSSNNSALQSMSPEEFFINTFGVPEELVKNSVQNYFPPGSSPSVNSLTSTSIWIDDNFTLTGNLGTPTSPVLLIVNGNFSMGSNNSFYGYVFVMGNIDLNGTADIYGAVGASGNIQTATGNTSINFDPVILNLVMTQTAPNIFYKIPGGWRDF